MSGIPAGAGSLLGKRLGKYEILALLALGGTAEIYLARIAGAAGFEKYVVVKCLHDHLADDPEFVKMFLDEARLAAHLDHSNIVQTMELGEYENRYYMVMEFLAGLSLAMVVRRASERLQGGRLPVPLSLNIIAQSCAGLHYAHERSINGKVLNIVHRDISPQNLVISFEGVVKVVDFGIAKAELRETKTRSGTIKGKFAYMSPEQCVATNVDRRTDVFALGVILWELLTGKRLFKRNSPYETYQAVIECKVEPPSKHNHELDPALDAIVMKALSKDKEHRYPSAESFGDALMGYLHHRGKGSGPSDVGRFFDAQFNKEIEEHGARMRDLIAHAAKDDFSVDTGVGWGEDEDNKVNLTVDLSKKAADALAASDARDRPSQQGLTGVIEDLEEPSIDDDDMPVEKTRIEANPLDRINELNAEAAKKPITSSRAASIPSLVKASGAPAPSSTSNTLGSIPQAPVLPGSAADDDKATIALQQDRAPTPVIPPGMRKASTPPASPAGRSAQPSPPVLPPSGAVALPPPPSGPVHIGTANAASNRPSIAGPRSATYVSQPNALASNPHGPTNVAGPLPPVGGPPPGHAPLPPAGGGMSNPMAQTHVPSLGGPANMPQRPSGFPASANLPTMIADQSGVTPAPANAAHMQQTLQPENNSYAPRGSDPYQSGPVPVAPMMPDSGSYSGVNPAHMMSPVGQHYPNQVDWAQAAAMPARALPPWMLAAIFAGVLLGALLITLLIAKIAT